MRSREQETGWTDERVHQLLVLWREGISASLIADKLGTTKGSVMGLIHRLRQQGQEIPARSSSRRRYRRWLDEVIPLRRKRDVPQYTPDGMPLSLNKRVAELDYGFQQCRWPTNAENESAAFCGHPVAHRSYCAHHAKLAYVKPDKRGRKLFRGDRHGVRMPSYGFREIAV